jgi:hypothetical protein
MEKVRLFGFLSSPMVSIRSFHLSVCRFGRPPRKGSEIDETLRHLCGRFRVPDLQVEPPTLKARAISRSGQVLRFKYGCLVS